MTRHDTLQCVHEPFGDAYYFGPERLAERYENDPEARKASGYENSTYRTIFDRIAKENSEVRLLIYLLSSRCTAAIFFIKSHIQISLSVIRRTIFIVQSPLCFYLFSGLKALHFVKRFHL